MIIPYNNIHETVDNTLWLRSNEIIGGNEFFRPEAVVVIKLVFIVVAGLEKAPSNQDNFLICFQKHESTKSWTMICIILNGIWLDIQRLSESHLPMLLFLWDFWGRIKK